MGVQLEGDYGSRPSHVHMGFSHAGHGNDVAKNDMFFFFSSFSDDGALSQL